MNVFENAYENSKEHRRITDGSYAASAAPNPDYVSTPKFNQKTLPNKSVWRSFGMISIHGSPRKVVRSLSGREEDSSMDNSSPITTYAKDLDQAVVVVVMIQMVVSDGLSSVAVRR
ncbi:hypothetical protein Fot_42313 [Forsythia ovata]|uniref:Uncharacterized protein n=1 Tax=Forsythia ovata TaxID=205694 RepID=A0ABD1RKT4_9LAMI